jgi:predicted amidophosphoribosyltransferase
MTIPSIFALPSSQRLYHSLFSTWIPRRCLVCEFPHTSLLCTKCSPLRADVHQPCWQCQEACMYHPVSSDKPSVALEMMSTKSASWPPLCYFCRNHENPSGGLLRSYGIYEGRNRAILHAAKYDPNHRLCQIIGAFMGAALSELFQLGSLTPQDVWDWVIPSLSSRARFATRGFSPPETIAYALGISVPVIRVFSLHSSRPHSSLAPRARINSSLTFEFTYKSPLQGARVLLIDDVVTTGTTLHTLASRLLDKGCSRVDSYTFLRARGYKLYRNSRVS